MPCLPRKMTLQPALIRSKRRGFAASPTDTAMPQENQRIRRDMLQHQNEHFVRDFFKFSNFVSQNQRLPTSFPNEAETQLPQNRCFVRGFRQFSAHITKCHACRGICTLSALDAALTMRFTKNEPHNTSKVLRLPREMTMEVSKVLRLPRKTQRIF